MNDSSVAEVVRQLSYANFEKNDIPKLGIDSRYGYSAKLLVYLATLSDGQAK